MRTSSLVTLPRFGSLVVSLNSRPSAAAMAGASAAGVGNAEPGDLVAGKRDS